MTKGKAQNGLQKVTDSSKKIDKVLALDRITNRDLEALSEAEKDQLMIVVTKMFNEAKGEERDSFYNKIEPITSEYTKNQLWEVNHNQITWAISALIQEYGRMPSKSEIARKVELSRQTVHKHLKEYASHPLYTEQLEQFRFMTSKVLARVYHFAVNGDTAAAKLYFNLMGNFYNKQTTNNTLIHNQNNNIQINGKVLSQEAFEGLTTEQLLSIENIFKSNIQTTNVD